MKFRLVRPILAPARRKPLRLLVLARNQQRHQLGVKQRLERMIKNTRHLSRRRAQPVQNRDVVQKRDHGRDQHPMLRDERLERAERMHVRRAQRKTHFLVCFPELI